KSATATESGRLPTPKLRTPWKLPSPLPKSSETVLEESLVTTRSGTASPLKSPTATEEGFLPASKSGRLVNDTPCAWAAAANSRLITANPAQTHTGPLLEMSMLPPTGLKQTRLRRTHVPFYDGVIVLSGPSSTAQTKSIL